MNIFPAIDLYGGKAVRLYKGDYLNMTVYNDDPVSVALDFKAAGAEFIHVVDLEGAKSGDTPNFDTVCRIIKESGLFVEIGGGIRSIDTVRRYVEAGAGRVILGTAALTDREFLTEALNEFGEKVAVGVDIKDGMVAIKGWTEKSEFSGMEFCKRMQSMGVCTIICTDISKDGAMKGTNIELYRDLQSELGINITASGGVSTLDDVKTLTDMGIYGAIIGKAYYTGAINLVEALEVAK
jgi:phosphoribosylformimino-5-aminoimidazole carboxamide ribotide isomerase